MNVLSELFEILQRFGSSPHLTDLTMKAMHGTAPKRAARMQRCRPRPHARDQRPSEAEAFRGFILFSQFPLPVRLYDVVRF